MIEQGRKTGVRRLRIWSAGCSSGEEPYTLAMVTSKAFKAERGWDIKILATDLDTEMLGKAVAGVYTTQAVSPVAQGVPREILLPARQTATRFEAGGLNPWWPSVGSTSWT